jgi:hypothetical protein
MTMTEPDRLGLDDLNDIAHDPGPTDNGWPIDDPDDIELFAGPLITAESWTPLNLADLPDKPPVQPTLGGVGLVYPGKRHVFSGPQESAKTLAAYAIGLQVVRADGILILIDFEMGAYDARDRLQELGATPDDLAAVRYLEPHEPADDQTMRKLLTLDPALVVVDAAAGAYDLQGLDDNKRQDVERFTRLYVRAFWRAGVATILLDHVVKNTELRGRYTIGSERKVGGADVHLGFDVIVPVSRGGNGRYKLTTHKDRGGFLKRGHIADLELQSDPETHQIKWAFTQASPAEPGELFRPTTLMEKVSVFLELQHEAVTRNTIESNVQGRAKFIRQAIDALAREGFALESDGARGAKLVESLRPYRHNDPDHNPETPTSSDLVSTSSGRSQLDLVSSSHPLQGGRGQDGPERTQKTATSSRRTDDSDIPF